MTHFDVQPLFISLSGTAHPAFTASGQEGIQLLSDVIKQGPGEIVAEHLTKEQDLACGDIYRQAYEEGTKKAKAHVTAIMERYQKAVADLENLRKKLLEDSEDQLVDLALHIAREVIGSDCDAKRVFAERMVVRAIELLTGSEHITVRVSKTDYHALLQRHPELFEDKATLKIIEDPALVLGGVIAESELGRVDASLERRLHDAAMSFLKETGELDSTTEQLP